MSEELNNDVKVEQEVSMDNFEEQINDSMKKVSVGDIVDAKIISVSDEELLVDLSYISDGVIKYSETGVNGGDVLNDHFSVEDTVKAKIVKTDDGDGNLLLSIKQANEVLVWEELKTALEEKSNLVVKVAEVVKGGVVTAIKGVRAFIPASLLSARYVEDLSVYVGKEIEVRVEEVDQSNRKIILSRKVIEKEELAKKKKEIFATIQKNDRFTGTVKKLMNFGAFVDIGGVDGLVHINDLSWEKVKHPSDVVKEGDAVEVYVINVDREKEKIGLGLKDVNENPWKKVAEQLKVGSVYEGTVERILDFGMFVKVLPSVEGLVHISQVSEERVEKLDDMFAVGDTVKVSVLSVDTKAKKISLSIKGAKEEEEKGNLSEFNSSEDATTSLKDVFGDIFKDLK